MDEIMKEMNLFTRASLKFQYYWTVKRAALEVKFLPKDRASLVYCVIFSSLIELSKDTGVPIPLIFDYFNSPKKNSSASLVFFMYFSDIALDMRPTRKKQEDAFKQRGLSLITPDFPGLTLFDLEKAYFILAAVFGVVISPEKAHRLRPIFQKLHCSVDSVIEEADKQKATLHGLCKNGFGFCDDYLAYHTDDDLRDLKDILPITPQFLKISP